MIALAIICAIVLIISLLLLCNIRAVFRFYGSELDFKVKYLWFTIYPMKEKKHKDNDSKKKSYSKKNNNSEETNILNDAVDIANDVEKEAGILTEEIGEPNKLAESIDKIKSKIEQIKIIWEFSEKPLKKLFRHIIIDDVIVDFEVSGDDAFEAAMNYGKVNAVSYNVLSFIRIWFTISIKSFDIDCDFNSKKSRYDGECSVNLRLCTAISVLAVLAFGFLKNKNELFAAGDAGRNSDRETVKA